jgi:hypothetical protein
MRKGPLLGRMWRRGLALVNNNRVQCTLKGKGRHSLSVRWSLRMRLDRASALAQELAQPRAASRNAACRAVSSALRNRDLSCLVIEAGPPVFALSSRRCRAISRPANAFPIFAGDQCFPVGETTRAPCLRQRDASGMSEVTQTSTAEICSAIQSSAASALSPTRTTLTFGVPGGRIGLEPLETTKTWSPRRAATR